MWHRGDEAKARDLFDLCVVIENSPAELHLARKFLLKNREAFLTQLQQRREILNIQFNQIDALDFDKQFDDCVSMANEFLNGLGSEDEKN